MTAKWEVKALGDICDLATGGTPSRARPEFFGGDIPWLVSGDINQGEIFECEGRITEAGMRSCNTKLLPKDSVMIALNGQGKTRATVAMLRTEATCNQSLVSIFPKDCSRLLPEFVFGNLHGRYEELRRLTSDDDKDRRGLNMGIIRGIRIPVPPVTVQRRIVGILDEAFAGIATAKANAEKNLQNSRAIFKAYLQSVFTQRSEGWVERRLGDVCDFGGGSQPPKSHFVYKPTPGYIRFLQIRDFGSDKNITFIPESKRNSLCDEADILIGRYGASVGKILTGKAGAYNVALMKASPNPAVLERGWFYSYLVSSVFQDLLRNVADRSAQAGFSKDDIYNFPVPIPAREDQRQLVSNLESYGAETQRLGSIYQRKLNALDGLKKSLLHQAFSGQL